MIANYVNEQHDTWDQFLREFAYAIRTAVNETTGKTPAELFLGRKLITPFQKLVMVSDGTEFAVGDIERWIEEARRNTETKQEKWKKNIIIDVGVMCKLRVLDVKNNNVVIWKAGKRLMINVDQVRIYRHRKCDETEIGTGNSDNGSLRDESSGFDKVQRRSNDSRDGKKKGSGGPERKVRKGSEHRVPKRNLSSNDTVMAHSVEYSALTQNTVFSGLVFIFYSQLFLVTSELLGMRSPGSAVALAQTFRPALQCYNIQ
ncbi:uncharacterized protein TNCV_2952081 [Trichonephila clavipes]|nr:uncharacterized protein TNCV_2952081 [Trichonephila clavipes]